MSMSITTGFRIEGLDLLLLHRRIASFRKVVGPMAHDAYATLVSRMACRLIDNAYADGKPWTPSPAWHVRNIVEDERRKLAGSSYRNPTYDFGFVVHFVPDARTRSIYGVVSCEHSEWLEAWMAQPFVEPYAYWDNTDRDDDVPAAEWRRRRSAWNRLVPTTSLSEGWMLAEMTHPHLFADLVQLVEMQPTEDERRRIIAADRAIAEDVARRGGDASIESVMKAMGALGTPEGRARVDDIARGVRIPVRIDEDMLKADRMPPTKSQGN